MTDDAFGQLVSELDQQVAKVDGQGFGIPPLQRNEQLGAKLGFREPGAAWVRPLR